MIQSKKHRYPKLIAHRGAGDMVPENTLAAFCYGAQKGYTMFECDVKFSQDEALVLMHDATLDRTTNSSGAINQQTWKHMSQLDAGSWHSAEFAGEPIARLDDLVDYVLDNFLRLDVEIKPNSGEAYETGAAVASLIQSKIYKKLGECLDLMFDEGLDQLFDRLYNENLENPTPYCIKKQFLLSSFDSEALRGAKDRVPRIPRALIVDDFSQGEAAVMALLDDLECEGIITNYKIMTPEFLEKCRKAGRFVMVYTSNDIVEIERLLAMGIDSVITDNMHAISVLGQDH